jgi:ribosomal protein S6
MADKTIYEVGFNIVPTLDAASLKARVDAIRALVTADGGAVIAEGEAKKIDLAYEMVHVAENKRAKFTSAYFGWIKFEASPAYAKAIAQAMKDDQEVIRFLLVKTVREDTMAPRALTEKEDEAADEAAIDAKIDEVVAEVE